MNKQYNFDDFLNHGEGNKAMGGVLAINISGKEFCDTYVNSFMPLDMTKEKAREEAMGFMMPGSDMTSCSDEEVAEYLINVLAYWSSIGLKELVRSDQEQVRCSLMLCTALISTLTDTDIWGVTADLESDGFMSRYKFKSLTKDEYIYCVKECLKRKSASN